MTVTPWDVTGPRNQLTLVGVVHVDPEGWSLALIKWQVDAGRKRALAIRWDAWAGSPCGYPHAFGARPQWFVMPETVACATLGADGPLGEVRGRDALAWLYRKVEEVPPGVLLDRPEETAA